LCTARAEGVNGNKHQIELVLAIYISQKIGTELFEESMFFLDIKRVVAQKLTLGDDTV